MRRAAEAKRARRAGGGGARRFERLRTDEPPGAGPRLFIATLRVRIPEDLWTGAFSARHRTVRLEVLNRHDLSRDTSVSDYWISGRPPGVWANEIAGFSDVESVESLAEVSDGCLYRIQYRNPPVVYQYRRLALPLQFPLRIQDGVITWEIIAQRDAFEELLQFARTRDPYLQISSVRTGPLRSHLPLLSEAQHRLLTTAMAEGYFAVPRRVSLTELAARLGRSKSALSEALARIEEKLLESSLRPSTLLP
jgi:predicted DNA binding protein